MPQLPGGLFITLEGGDGTGKSTQARLLADRLRNVGHAVCLTEEPGGAALGRHVRTFFEQQTLTGGRSIAPEAELFLFEAARSQHVTELIRPALTKGEVVLCDRYGDSSIAYQGYGRGLDLGWIRECNAVATGGLTPALTLLFDLDTAAALARVAAAHAGHERRHRDAIEDEPLAFHERVRQGFLALAGAEPDRIVVIDAGAAPEAVAEQAWVHVEGALRRVARA